jgi:hypothetical protein
MRFVGIAVVLLSFFAFLGLLRSRPHSRALTLGLLGFMLFFGEEYRFDANIFSWPLWTGTAKGILISPVDTLCLALLMTRTGPTPKLLFVPVIAIYGFFLAFSVLMSTVPVASLFSCWQFARGALLFVTIGTECARAASRDTFLKGLAFGLIFQSGFVVTQKLGGVVQASGTMYHQNTLGAMTALALMPLLATLLAGNRSKWIALGVVGRPHRPGGRGLARFAGDRRRRPGGPAAPVPRQECDDHQGAGGRAGRPGTGGRRSLRLADAEGPVR